MADLKAKEQINKV